MTQPWHETDDWWESMGDVLFPPERMESASEQIDGLLGIVEALPGLAALDLGCGPGRHSVELARRGFTVTGVDRTELYLARARAAAEDASVAVDFVQGDMRGFCRAESFDLVVNLFTTFGYFEDPSDARRVLDNIRRSLRPGGRLVIDTMSREVLARTFTARRWDRLGDGRYFLQESRISDDWTWLDGTWILVGPEGVREYPLSHRIYGAADLTGLLAQVGFEDIRIFGSLGGAPYGTEAQRLVLVASR